MPDQESARDIDKKPKGDSFIESPSQSPGNQRIPSTTANGNTSCDKNDSKQLENEFKVAEKWLIGIGIASVLINVVIALIYYGQLRQMRDATASAGKSADAAKKASDTADATLKEMQKGGTDTHTLAVAAGQTAEAAKIQAFAARSQVAPLMQLDEWMGSYHLEDSNRIVAVVAIKNVGKTPAEHVSIALSIGLQHSPPTPSQYGFKDVEFQGDRQLIPFLSSQERTTVVARAQQSLDKSISPAQYPAFLQKKAALYIWGKVKFSDSLGQSMPSFSFCKYVPLQSVLQSPASPLNLGRGGISIGYSECEQITAASYP
jgi:Sec-independent protein translocase protein TatA